MVIPVRNLKRRIAGTIAPMKPAKNCAAVFTAILELLLTIRLARSDKGMPMAMMASSPGTAETTAVIRYAVAMPGKPPNPTNSPSRAPKNTP